MLYAITIWAFASASAAAVSVDRFEMHEVRLQQSDGIPAINPFELECFAIVTHSVPKDKRHLSRHPNMNVSFFYDGNSTYAFRFTPDAVGTWDWSTTCPPSPSIDAKKGSVSCADSGSHTGGIIADPQNPQHFVHEDGSRYLLVGYEVDWLWALGLEADTMEPPLEDFLDHVKGYGFNHLLVTVFSNFSTWNAPLPDRVAPKIAPTLTTPWVCSGGSGSGNVWKYDTLDLRFFRHWDHVFRTLEQKGLVAHLMMYVGNKGVVWPMRNTTSDDIYWRHVLARFGSYSSVVFDVSKEAGSYGISSEYVHKRLSLIHEMNAHKRLVTSHSGMHWSNECEGCNLTMITVQKHFDNHTSGAWYDDLVRMKAKHPTTPVTNLEFMYESSPIRQCNGSCCHDCASTVDDKTAMRQVMWDLYMAGGYGAWYDCDTAWDVITINKGSVPSGYYWVKQLVKFWTDVGYETMSPQNSALIVSEKGVMGHCLANKHEYVVHVRKNVPFKLTLLDDSAPPASTTSASSGTGSAPAVVAVSGVWFDPGTGQSVPFSANELQRTPHYGQTYILTPPKTFSEDVALHLKVAH
jgi:hypothetical protein